MSQFLTLKKSGPYFRPDFFKVPDPKKISGRPDNLEYWVQIDWAKGLWRSQGCRSIVVELDPNALDLQLSEARQGNELHN